MTLPRLLMVTEEKEGDETYFIAHKNLEAAMDDAEQHRPRVVGVYRLVLRNKAVKSSRVIATRQVK